MVRINRILACVDLSDYSKRTMEYAVSMARGLMAEIIVLNVININEISALEIAAAHYPEHIDIKRFIEDTKADRFKRVQALISDHFSPDSSKITSLVEIGVPFKTILDVVEREHIDVVVQGSKGRGNAPGTLFGSHAEKVFRHSPVPVFSIRNGASHKR